MTAGRRDQLAEAARDDQGISLDLYCGRYAIEPIIDALLPTVDRMIRQAQAEALEQAWQDGYGHGRDDEANGMPIRDRAAALTTDQAVGTDPHAGAETAQDGIDRANRYTDTPDPGTTAERR